MFKFLAFAALVAVAQAGLIAQPGLAYSSPLAYSAPVAKIATPLAYAAPVAKVAYGPAYAKVAVDADYDPNPQYSFAYDVQDHLTGDSKNQHESRSGDVVQGSYSLVDPDGFKRTVEYTADPHNGFNAVVHREPLAVKVAAPIAKVVSPVAYAAPVAKYAAPLAYAAPVAKYAAPLGYGAASYYH